MKASDVFVLFVAGHGRTVELTGTYYFLPRDLTFEGGRTVEDGIGQDTWQAWLKQIAAQKRILVSDTCESSAAAGLTRGSVERDTAIDRLRNATGRSVITAALDLSSAEMPAGTHYLKIDVRDGAGKVGSTLFAIMVAK